MLHCSLSLNSNELCSDLSGGQEMQPVKTALVLMAFGVGLAETAWLQLLELVGLEGLFTCK